MRTIAIASVLVRYKTEDMIHDPNIGPVHFSTFLERGIVPIQELDYYAILL